VAEDPSAQQCAKRILRVYREHGLSAGMALEFGSFVAPFAKLDWDEGDIDAGLAEAIEEDWLERVSGSAYRLTPLGFANTPKA
jgi:hypothetical protein